MSAKESDNTQARPHPYRVRLPGFVSDEEVGLGEAIQRVAYTVGIKTCGGCEQRAAMLNRWLVFTGRAK